MFSKTFILALFATAAIAAPGKPAEGSRIIVCNQTFLKGDCAYLRFHPGQCIYTLTRDITSLDSKSWKCRYYAGKRCNGDNIPTDGLINDIAADSKNSGMDKRIKTVRCDYEW